MIGAFKRMAVLNFAQVPDDSLQKFCISIALGFSKEKQKVKYKHPVKVNFKAKTEGSRILGSKGYL